jgi:hypothetical protein
VISIFHETKIQTVDMKVQVYSKFRKIKISKKVKSPNSVRNGRFDTSKCRGQLEKMGVLCTHFPKSPGPFPKLPKKKIQKNIKNSKQKGQSGPIQASTRRPRVDAWTGPYYPSLLNFFFLLPSTFCASGQFLLVGCNTCLPCPEFT